jgi:HJR/Mrr/RecB family endonuclease
VDSHGNAVGGDTPALIARLKADPQLLHHLPGRDFVLVIGELLASLGWQVSLTSESRDAGIDILESSRDVTGFETSWMVECKQYSADGLVGDSAVMQLYASQQSLGIPRALLVTTNRLSSQASSRVG